SDTSRLDLLDANAPVIREIVGKLRNEGFEGVLVMASNPVDLLVQVALEESGLPAGRVIGTGTLVDTARLRGMLAEAFDIEPRGVDAYIIGEHG
ncbi:lactate/malate family dehydrogenase, partial [Mycobacterium tuberculosis]